METIRKIYITPDVEVVTLDNEISLALQSVAPPAGPEESQNTIPFFNNEDPFKVNKV